MLENYSTSQNFLSLEYTKQGDDNIPSSLSKDEFPPVFDETSSVTRPKLGDHLKIIQRDSGSSIVSDDKSYQSVSILITDTSNVPSVSDEPKIAIENDDSHSNLPSIENLKDDEIQIHQKNNDRYFILGDRYRMHVITDLCNFRL